MNAKLDNEHFIYLSSNNKDIIGGITSLGSAIIIKLNKSIKTIKSFSKIPYIRLCRIIKKNEI